MPRIPLTDVSTGSTVLVGSAGDGVVVFDDVQLPQVSLLIENFIEPDDRWQELAPIIHGTA